MPVLGDLYQCLREQKEVQAQRIATALEIYVNGSLKVFNHRTNVELNNRIVCFDIKDLGKQLKKLGMLIVQDQVWNRVTVNRALHKSTRYYIDEFHLLLKEEQTAAYSVEIWKRFRKWGGIPTGITQNIKDLLASREIENIFENSDFIYMLNQAAGDRQILAKQLNISPHQLSYVTNSGEGEGLIFYGSTIIPFKDKFDKSLRLYALMTTKPRIWKEQEKRREKQNVKNGYDYQWGLSGGAKSLPDESIHCCVTSPPYYALRDYGKENQIGREGAPEEYIGHLVSVFCELKRVLRSDGTFWLNIADCYSRNPIMGCPAASQKN
mgnify:FL=1